MTPETAHAVDAECRILEFDSEFFGCRIARIEPAALARDGGSAVDRWCRDHVVECAYLLVDPEAPDTIAAAEKNGFGLIDIRVSLSCRTGVGAQPALDQGVIVRPAERADLASLRTIARTSHRQTRFYIDGRFDRDRCDALYDLWISKSCDGWADAVLVAEAGGAVVGYVTCTLRSPETGEIGLVGVDAASRGRGYGRALIGHAVRWFAAAGRQRIDIATQGGNTAALRLYQRAGFEVDSIRLWYHKWW